MRESMPVALILVDALSLSYVSEQTAATICDVGRDGYLGPLENIYAYRGIEATMFTGLSPDKHGVWGEFRPSSAPNKSNLLDTGSRQIVRLGDMLPSDRLRLDVRYMASKLCSPNHHLPTGNLIPVDMMQSFSGSVDKPIWEEGALHPNLTLLDELRIAGRTFEVVGYPTIHRDDQIIDHVARRTGRGTLPDFWYIKFSTLDALGHKHGPDVLALGTALKTLDGQLRHLIEALQRAYSGEIEVVLLSDHGMSAVHTNIDVRPLLKKTGLKAGRDYTYFLDSTTVRFWSENNSALTRIAEVFGNSNGLRLLGNRARHDLNLPADASTGDLLFALGEGCVVFPDFFRMTGAPLGMHGYAEVSTEAGLPLLALGPQVSSLLPASDKIGHADVWDVIRRCLGMGSSVDTERMEELNCIC